MPLNRRRASLVLALGLALSGCMGGSSGEVNRSLDSIHQPVVTIQSYVFDAETSNNGLAPTEMRRVSDWFDAMGVRYGDRIAVDQGTGGHHLGVEQRVAGEQAMEIPAMAIRPPHHGRDRQAPGR